MFFGYAQVFIFMSNMPNIDTLTLSILLFIVWFSPLVRVGCLSNEGRKGEQGPRSLNNPEPVKENRLLQDH